MNNETDLDRNNIILKYPKEGENSTFLNHGTKYKLNKKDRTIVKWGIKK